MSTEPTTSPTSKASQDFIARLLTFFTLNALLIYLIYSENFVMGSLVGQWAYPYFKTTSSTTIWVPLGVLCLLIPMVFLGSKWIHSHEKLVLAGCFLAGLAIQLLIHSPYPFNLGTIVRSDIATSFYTPAMTYSPVEILREYDTLAPSFPMHARSNMPGKILLFQIMGLFTTAPQRMGYIVIALSSLGAILLYGICIRLFHNKLLGLFAFILYVLVPCKNFFFPILNTVTPVFILACLYLWLLYIDRKKSLFLWLLGGTLYFLVLFEPTPLAMGIIFLGILLHALGEKKVAKNEIWVLIVIPLLGFLVLYIFFRAVFSFDLLSAFQYVLRDATSFNTIDQRDYWIWIFENPKEFLFNAGIPVMLLFIYLASDMISQLKTLGIKLTHWPMDKIYLLSLLATLLTLVVLGINRGEITRLWIYLAVFFQVPAAYFLAKIEYGKVVFFLVACILAIQSIITLQRVAFITL